MQGFYRNLALWFLLILFLVVLYNIFHVPEQAVARWNYSDFVTAIEKGNVRKVTIVKNKVEGETSNNKPFVVYTPEDPQLLSMLRQHQVTVEVEPVPEDPLWKPLLISWFPMLLIIGLWVMMIRQMQTGGGKAMAFGKARVRLANENPTPITFADVAGVDEAKEELKEIVDFLKDPGKFTRFGGRIPKGVLLIGSPGAGKTLLAKAVAGEAGVPFYSISGSDFVEMFVGVGASRVRDLFMQARKSAPGIVFIDEIDAVGRHRGAGLGGGHDEREQTLNQLLVEMDGMDSSEGVIIIAATNRPDVLDPALLRPGRFDRRVVVPLPDWKGRREIIGVHIKKKKVPLAADVDIEALARATPGFSGADLENLVNEAALLAARKYRDPSAAAMVTHGDFEYAKDKVLMGAERRSMVLTEKEKRITAYHEAGHALVAKYLPGSDPVHKVTIIPRGMALGLTQQLPEQEMHTYSRDYLHTNLKVLMGGRAAEEIAFNSITTGAGNDIERATELARRMVCEWGMSDKIGPLRFGKGHSEVFLGRDFANVKDYSESTAILIDQEVRDLVNHSYAEAKRILLEHKSVLDAVSMALLERETIGAAELDLLMAGQTLPPLTRQKPMPPSAANTTDGDKSKQATDTNPAVGPLSETIPAGASVSG